MPERATNFALSAPALAAIELFANLAPRQRAAIVELLQARRHAPKAVVFAQDDPSRDVYFVISGRARATWYSGLGREIAFLDLEAGATFGELAALDDGPRSARVEVIESAIIARMAQRDFLALLAREPALALAVMRGLAATVRRLSDRVVEFSTIGVRERLHAELLRLAHSGEIAANAARVPRCPTHLELATRISTHREAVSRELSRLRKQGLLRSEHRTLIITDLARLAAMVASARGAAS